MRPQVWVISAYMPENPAIRRWGTGGSLELAGVPVSVRDSLQTNVEG